MSYLIIWILPAFIRLFSAVLDMPALYGNALLRRPIATITKTCILLLLGPFHDLVVSYLASRLVERIKANGAK